LHGGKKKTLNDVIYPSVADINPKYELTCIFPKSLADLFFEILTKNLKIFEHI